MGRYVAKNNACVSLHSDIVPKVDRAIPDLPGSTSSIEEVTGVRARIVDHGEDFS